MPLPLLAFLFGGTAIAGIVLVAAKNVRGEDVKLGRRSIVGEYSGDALFMVQPDGHWNAWNAKTSPTGAGPSANAPSRKDAFVAAMASAESLLPIGKQSLEIDFLESNGDLVFRVSVIPSGTDWLMQVLDPRATVEQLKMYGTRRDAALAGFDYVVKRGY